MEKVSGMEKVGGKADDITATTPCILINIDLHSML